MDRSRRALDKAGIDWSKGFAGGGVTRRGRGRTCRHAKAPLAKRVAPTDWIDVGPALACRGSELSKVMRHSKVSGLYEIAVDAVVHRSWAASPNDTATAFCQAHRCETKSNPEARAGAGSSHSTSGAGTGAQVWCNGPIEGRIRALR